MRQLASTLLILWVALRKLPAAPAKGLQLEVSFPLHSLIIAEPDLLPQRLKGSLF